MKFKNVAVGGTFDRFSQRPRKLLNEAFNIGAKCVNWSYF